MKKYILSIVLLFFTFKNSNAQSGEIISGKKISSTNGNFSGIGLNIVSFGSALCHVGDVNLDGINDIAVSAFDKDSLNGQVFILFMNKNGSVLNYSKIAPNQGGFNGNFSFSMSSFGRILSSMPDLDGDGINELIVSAPFGGQNSTGVVFILFINESGFVKKYWTIANQSITLTSNAYFGISTSFISRNPIKNEFKIAISAIGNNVSGSFNGTVFLLTLDSSVIIKKNNTIDSKTGNFTGLTSGNFGNAILSINDLDNDGNKELIVSSITNLKGEMWILFLDSMDKVIKHQKIDNISGNYFDTITNYEGFATRLANLGDIDNDGITDVAVGSGQDSVNGIRTGRVRILFLNNNGTVKAIKRIDNNSLNLPNSIANNDIFPSSISGNVDINGDFKNDLIITASGTDDGGTDKGAIYLLNLDGAVHPTPPKALWRVNATSGNQNTVFNFTQYSTGFPNAYKWNITPNTFTYQSGTLDTSANPIIKFNETANYSVQLKVTNPFSSDSLLRSSYISVQKVGGQ